VASVGALTPGHLAWWDFRSSGIIVNVKGMKPLVERKWTSAREYVGRADNPKPILSVVFLSACYRNPITYRLMTEGTNMGTDPWRKNQGNDTSRKLKEHIFYSFFPAFGDSQYSYTEL